MRTWTTEVELPASPVEVWKTLIDFANAERWNPNAGPARILTSGPFGPGTKVEVRKGTMTTILTVTVCDIAKRLTLEVKTGQSSGSSEFILTPSGSSTLLHHRLILNVRGVTRLFSPLIGMSLQKEFAAMRSWLARIPSN